MTNSTVVTHETPQKHEVIFSSVIPQKTYKFNFDSLPDTYKIDIQKAVEILKQGGCKEIYLFGSLVTGKYHENSDIDIGIKGLAPDKFFDIYSKFDNFKNTIDLVDFDESNSFYSVLYENRRVIKIG